MKRVLFIILPFPSHYFVAFGTANYLKNEGYRVVFTGRVQQADLVKNEGFEFHRLVYFSEYRNLSFRTYLALLLKTILDKSFTKNRYREFYSCLLEFQNLYKTINPDLVFIDHHLGEYALFLQKCNSKIVILNTKLSCYQSTGIPPLRVGWVSKNRIFDKLRAEFDWFKFRIKNKQKKIIELLAFAGTNDKLFFKRWAKKNDIVWDTFFYENSSTYNIVKNIPKLITYPQCIEYPFKKVFPDEFYIQTPFHKNENLYFTNKYHEVFELISIKKTQNKNLKIIYCALGTISNNVRKRAEMLLFKIVEAVKFIPDVILILANDALPKNEIILSENIFVFEKVPQLHVLKYADLMITHGGLNSICECIQAKVPMLAFPLIMEIDHPGNSARVVANGFGLQGDIEKDTIKGISTKITNLLINDSYVSQLKKVQNQNSLNSNIDSFIINL